MAFVSKTNVSRALSLKSFRQQTTLNTHSLFLSLGLEPTCNVGTAVSNPLHKVEVNKNQEVGFVQKANWIPVLLKFLETIHLGSKAFILSQTIQIISTNVQTNHKRFGFLPKLHKSQLQTMTSATTQSVVLVMVEK